jgi:hypothetical protein
MARESSSSEQLSSANDAPNCLYIATDGVLEGALKHCQKVPQALSWSESLDVLRDGGPRTAFDPVSSGF